MEELRLKAIAHHEAGHAVVDLAVGAEVMLATIIPNEDEGSLGHVQRRDLEDEERFNPDIDTVRMYVCGCHAGGIAERRFLNSACRMDLYDDDGCSQDREHAADWACSFASYQEIIDEEAARAELLVSMHWASIERVAAALLDRKTLTGDEIKSLL